MFPSAESRYREAVKRLDAYVAGLRGDNPTSRPIITRNSELIPLLTAWNVLLGTGHADLYKTDTDWLQVDDDFYRVTGYCHVIANMLPARGRARVPHRARQPSGLRAMFREIHAPLARCAVIAPVYVFNGRDSGGACQLAPQPRRLRQRGPPEDLLDPRRAREVTHATIGTGPLAKAKPSGRAPASGERRLRAAFAAWRGKGGAPSPPTEC